MNEIRNVRYPLQTMLRKQRQERSEWWQEFFTMAGFCSMMVIMIIFAGLLS
ncbi:MAG: hypothetical protein PHQ46_11170 [Negativicutes bacterium]|nr:hypothetical protein [Negativicutes bacterium]